MSPDGDRCTMAPSQSHRFLYIDILYGTPLRVKLFFRVTARVFSAAVLKSKNISVSDGFLNIRLRVKDCKSSFPRDTQHFDPEEKKIGFKV